jgi:hypothetical protein
MRVDEFDKVVDKWKNYILRGPLEDYTLEIDPEISRDIAAIALFLDQKTVKASGEVEEFYDGYKTASTDILQLVGVSLEQDDGNKIIRISVAPDNAALQEELQKHIWGE